MVHKPTLLGTLTLVFGALAAPPSGLQARLARRREGQSQPLDHQGGPIGPTSDSLSSPIQYSANWAGSVLTTTSANFTCITGTFTVPQPTGNDGAASVWVGIDGDTCGNTILQTGIDMVLSGGQVTYAAWYEWYPDAAYDFSGITVSAGDVITATVTASTTTSGTVTVENQTTGESVTISLASSTPLCEQSAEWIVEDFTQNGTLVPLVDFGTVTFTNAMTSGPNIYATPVSGTIFDIQQNNQVLTSVSADGDSSVTIQYAGNGQ